jgi:perosamine synthetase
MQKQLPWWSPQTTGAEHGLVEKVLASNYLNDGDVTTQFEQALADRLGVRHVVATTSGTIAIFLGLAGVGVGPGDDVLVPDVTFIATANAVRLTGARPVLVDVDAATLNMDPAAAARALTPRTKAIVPVHVSGRGADVAALGALAAKHGLAMVEDAAEAFLSVSAGRPLGTHGIAGCFSLSPNKTITTGQGGFVVTNDEALHGRLRQLKDQGRSVRGTGGDDLHPVLGYNFKFTNLQAAVGLGQLTALDKRLARQRRIYEIYASHLSDVSGLRLPGFNIAGGEVPQWTDAVIDDRALVDAYLLERDVHCRRFWLPLHRQEPYRQADDRFPNSTRLMNRAIWLPSAYTMTDEDVVRVTSLIRESLGCSTVVHA